MHQSIAHIRTNYTQKTLDENEVNANPFLQFEQWFNDALNSHIHEVNAMSLATVNKALQPSIRIVLLKEFTTKHFIFFTNYTSRKANEIETNNKVALLFFWKELERQIRIEGTINKIPSHESESYFKSRPLQSQIGAWASQQSSVIENRAILDEQFTQYTQQFNNNVPYPKHWGGYAVTPTLFEFWQGRSNRLHDRIEYTLQNDQWQKQRLSP
jgi:pyridoxamine 5'-phosphate oxidase